MNKELELAIGTMIIKSKGHKYEDVKKRLKDFYDMRQFSFPYHLLEEMFDHYWANTIMVVDKEDLK